MDPRIKISRLNSTDKELILKIAQWYFEEWGTPIEKTLQRLSNQPGTNTLFQLVLSLNDKAIATGGLCNKVNIFNRHKKLRKFNPWVALLYTHEDYRNQGLGKMLLNEIEHNAQEIGLHKIYLYTFTAESLYKRCGWTEIDRVPYKEHDTAVMEKNM